MPTDGVITDVAMGEEVEQEVAGASAGKPTFSTFVRWTVHLFKKHFWWSVAAIAIPTAINAVMLLLEGLGLEARNPFTTGSLLSLFLGLPLASGAFVAILWRMLGRSAVGSLDKSPVVAIFHGLRFFGAYLVWGMAMLGVFLVAFMPAMVVAFVFFSGVSTSLAELLGSPSESALLLAAAVAGSILILFLFSRWSIALPIMIAEIGKFSTRAFKESTRRVKGRAGSVFAFYLVFAVFHLTLGRSSDLFEELVWVNNLTTVLVSTGINSVAYGLQQIVFSAVTVGLYRSLSVRES